MRQLRPSSAPTAATFSTPPRAGFPLTSLWRRPISIVGSCLCSRSPLHRGAMLICSLRSFTTALITLFLGVGLATSAISQARTSDASGAEPPFAHSREGIRELYIIAFGLFGPESVFASEATKAGEIMRARLQADAQLLVRFNDKRGGSATSASLAAALRSAGKAMDPNKDILAVFLTSHGGPEGLDLVAGRRRETLSPRSLRAMLNASGARYRVIIISACVRVCSPAHWPIRVLSSSPRPHQTVPHSVVRTAQPGPILEMLSSIKLSAARGLWTRLFVGPRHRHQTGTKRRLRTFPTADRWRF